MMSKTKRLLSLIGGVIAGGLLLSFGMSSLSGRPQTGTEQTYNRKCASCHAKDGSGKTTNGKKYGVKDVRLTVKKDSEDEMIKIVKDGKGKNMDSYSDELSAAEIKTVVEYYRSLAKK
jgi:mono/diheme cytochrome c family protein